MARVLLAGLIGMVVTIVIGPRFISFLRRKEYGQQIRAEMPAHHATKQGTPTAGGVLILLAALIAFLPLTFRTLPALTVAFTAVACGAIGFIDDFIKLTHQRSLGLSGRWKLLLLALTTVGVGVATHHQQLRHDVYIPVVNYWLPLSYFWYVLLFLIIAGCANGVNLTDGIDGLAAGTSIIALFAVAAMSVTFYLRSAIDPTKRIETRLDIAIVAAGLIGAAIGFLWFNAFPAEVFMGDTGAMALGGAIAGAAIMMKVEVLLLFIAGIFVIEAVSVILQVFTFKYLGRRVFLMAPIHHHFEMKAWSGTKIMVRFWIITAILCTAGFALFYKYYAVPH
jgi:phospho-N-acetylmuramoyl-pentapeptide-transferase